MNWLAFLKAIPGIATIVKSIVELIKFGKKEYDKAVKKSADKKLAKKHTKYDELTARHKKATTDEERAKLVKKINALNV